jgi:hypothetical protein
MAEIPHSWGAYARLQERLARTTNIKTAAAMEAALNVVHRANFQPEAVTDDVLKRVADTAGRRERDHSRLRRAYGVPEQGGQCTAPNDSGSPAVQVRPQSLDEEVHASRELSRMRTIMPEPDWDLLIGIAAGASYEELAVELTTSSGALRSRVCRLRQTIA